MARDDSSQATPLRLCRRRLLLSTSIGLTTLAGCGGTSNTNTDSTPTSPATTGGSDTTAPETGVQPTNTDSDATAGPPTYTIDATVPETAVVGQEITYNITIENTGGTPSSDGASYGLRLSAPGTEQTQSILAENLTLDPGATKSVEPDPLVIDAETTIQWMFFVVTGDGEETVLERQTKITLPLQSFDDSYLTPTDLEITPSEPELTTTYTYEDFAGETQTVTADSEQQFALIELRVVNEADDLRETPGIDRFEIRSDDQQFAPLSGDGYEADDRYNGQREIADGGVASGVLPFSIDRRLTQADVELFYSDTNFEQELTWETIWE